MIIDQAKKHFKRAWARYTALSGTAALAVNDFLAAAGEAEISVRTLLAGILAIVVSAWEDIRNLVKKA